MYKHDNLSIMIATLLISWYSDAVGADMDDLDGKVMPRSSGAVATLLEVALVGTAGAPGKVLVEAAKELWKPHRSVDTYLTQKEPHRDPLTWWTQKEPHRTPFGFLRGESSPYKKK